MEKHPIHHGNLNYCDFPLHREFLCRREKRVEEGYFLQLEKGCEDPVPGREMHLEEKRVFCGGHTAIQCPPKDPAWSELESGQTQEKVPLG